MSEANVMSYTAATDVDHLHSRKTILEKKQFEDINLEQRSLNEVIHFPRY